MIGVLGVGVVLAVGPDVVSAGGVSCGLAIDADDHPGPVVAGNALIAGVFDADPDGCDEWRVDLTGTFHLTEDLFWDFAEPLVLAGPTDLSGDAELARLVAVSEDGPDEPVTHRLITVEPFPAGAPVGALTLERLVLQSGSIAPAVSGGVGGAVRADVVRILDSELRDNRALDGGAVFARTVHAERVSFVDNLAVDVGGAGDVPQGGAIRASEEVTLVNVTFRGNSATEGGAVWLPAAGTLSATFVTFLDNVASSAGVVAAGGADLHRWDAGGGGAPGPVTLRGVLFGGVGATPAGDACGGVPLPAAGAIAVDASCGVPALAGTLTFATVPFLPGTTAIPVPDVAPAAVGAVACDPDDGTGDWPATDQRGETRPQGDTCDAGAVERAAVTPTVLPDDDNDDDAGDDVGGPVPTAVPAGDGTCADGCLPFSWR